jgi:signal peptidase
MIIRRTLNAIGKIVQFLLLGLLIFMTISQMGFGPLRFIVVRSGSMEPTIGTGDLAVVNVTEDAQQGATVGDVVLFDNPDGKPMVHRVIAMSDEGMTTKGDANEDPDPWRIEQVNGVQVATVPLVGYGLQYLQNGFRVIASALR